MAQNSTKASAAGFDGEFTRLGLADVIQLNAQNRFSGCIGIHSDGRRGLIFLRNGEVIHAEHEGVVGESAFYEIVSWPGGRFVLQENVATTRSSIEKSCSFLLLEAHRRIDERRAHRPAPAAPAPAAKPESAGALLGRLRAIPGVLFAVLQAKDGTRIGDDSYEAELIAGQAQYLALAGSRLSGALKAGDVNAATVQGAENQFLLLVAKSYSLAILLEADARIGAIEADVRKALSPGR